MNKTIYESFIRTHLTYCLPIWGSKKTASLTSLKKLIKKSWSKIGMRRQHTNERLLEHKILKLEDELSISEAKIIWRWEKNKIPLGIKSILTEIPTNNLRNRKFQRDREWSHDSIAYRLASRAMKEIKDIEIAKSKKGLVKKFKDTTLLLKYDTPCTIRNCYICINP